MTYHHGLDRAGHALADKIQMEKHDKAWAKYYAEKGEKTLTQILADSVNDPGLTDAEFRALVRRSLPRT